MMSDFKVKMH